MSSDIISERLFEEIKETIYCFVATSSADMISRMEQIGSKFRKLRSKDGTNTYLYTNHQEKMKDDIISFSIFNDLGDYDVSVISSKLKSGNFIEHDDSESLISLSTIGEEYFACISDFWGIMTHYWYDSGNSFICSNNIFFVSALTQEKISRTSLYEYLFFLAPLDSATWYENIKSLLPGQQLIFNLADHTVKLSEPTDFTELFKPVDNDIIEAIRNFMAKAKSRIASGATNYIALSSGSDSRTVLACLRYFDMNPHALSFGQHHLRETKRIEQLVNKLNIPWNLVDIDGFEKEFDQLSMKGTLISNGFLNPLRSHYIKFYESVDEGNTVFEGFFGSKFVKGEIPRTSHISKSHEMVIVEGASVNEAIETCYPDLSVEFKDSMSQYLTAKYELLLKDINSDEGYRDYLPFLFKITGSKLFSGHFALMLANGIAPYYPFLCRNFLRSLFSRGGGVASSIDLRRDFVGPIKCIQKEAEIVRFMDKQIYKTVLDRQFSFMDSLLPSFFATIKRKYNVLINKIKTSRVLKTGQIDNIKIEKIIEDLSNSSDMKVFPLSSNTHVTNPLLTKAMVNISYIEKVNKSFTHMLFGSNSQT
jgi:hypothetical protein